MSYDRGRQYPRLYAARVRTRQAFWWWLVLWVVVAGIIAVIGLFR